MRAISSAFLFFCLIRIPGAAQSQSVNCHVEAAHAPTDAEQAFLHSNYDQAAALYQQQLLQKPNDPALTSGLALVYLRQEKIKEADDLVHKALSQSPQSVVLLTSLGQIQYREGAP